MKSKIKKIVSLFLLGFIILYAGYISGYWTKYYIYKYKANPERILKKDTIGGKTPRETYEMFLSALRLGNLELASKYFVLSKQEEKLKEFQILREKGELTKYIDGLPEWGEVRENGESIGELREFNYKRWTTEKQTEIQGKIFTFPAGDYAHTILFRLNPLTNIWKIEIL